MEILDKILEIFNTPLIIGGGLTLSVGGAIYLIIKAIFSPKKADLTKTNKRVGVLELNNVENHNRYATKEQYNELLNLVKAQNELQRKQIATIKNVAKRQELENERLDIENALPNELVEEKVVEVIETPKTTKKKRF